MTNQHDKTNFCHLCEHHSREAIAARAEVRALKAELLRRLERLDYYTLDVSDGPDIMMSDNEWFGRLKEKNELKNRIRQLENELEESRKAGGVG